MKSASRVVLLCIARLTDSQCQDQPRQEITVTLPDGAQRTGTSWETSPLDIAKEISKGLADKVVIAKVSSQDSVSSKVTVADMYLVALLSLFACRGGTGLWLRTRV